MFVRTDISRPQQAVQAAHALLETVRGSPSEFCSRDHPHFVLCGVSCEDDLSQISDYLALNEISHRCWREPDSGNELMSLSTVPVCGKTRKLFKKFKLLK